MGSCKCRSWCDITGAAAITIGTSGAVRTISSNINTDEKGERFVTH